MMADDVAYSVENPYPGMFGCVVCVTGCTIHTHAYTQGNCTIALVVPTCTKTSNRCVNLFVFLYMCVMFCISVYISIALQRKCTMQTYLYRVSVSVCVRVSHKCSMLFTQMLHVIHTNAPCYSHKQDYSGFKVTAQNFLAVLAGDQVCCMYVYTPTTHQVCLLRHIVAPYCGTKRSASTPFPSLPSSTSTLSPHSLHWNLMQQGAPSLPVGPKTWCLCTMQIMGPLVFWACPGGRFYMQIS